MLYLTREQENILALLSGEKIKSVEVGDWNKIIEEALAQSVFLMIRMPEKLPAEVSVKWEKTYYALLENNMQEFYTVTEVNRIMHNTGRKYVILKGVSSALYYPDIFQRALGDVDFLIDPAYVTDIECALTEEGYIKGRPDYHHTAFKKEKQNIEMHVTFPGMPIGPSSTYIREYMCNILDETISYKINETIIELPQPKYHGLILLLHMQHHMTTTGIGLRHLIDWCYFVDKTQNDEFWKTDLLPVLRKTGLFYFAAVMTRVGAIYLHTAEPEWCIEIDDKLCDNIMNDIWSGGNFGRKNKERSESSMMISNHNTIGTQGSIATNLYYVLRKNMIRRHCVVQKYPFLFLLYFPEAVVIYFFHVLKGERKSLFVYIKYAKERKKVYDQLHLFENVQMDSTLPKDTQK